MTPTAGQVWEHRHLCRLCKTGTKPHRHRYLVIGLAGDGQVLVRDFAITGNTLIADRYTRSREIFGSLGKGGLRLAGHMVNAKIVRLPAAMLDSRVVEHFRIPLNGLSAWRVEESDRTAPVFRVAA